MLAVITCRVNTGLLDLAHDGVLAAADRLVLIVHDRPGAGCCRIAQVTSKARDSRDDDDDTELAALLARTNAGIDDGAADSVEDGTLLVTGRRD